MKTIRDRAGRLRRWYEADEIEDLAEAGLRNGDLWPGPDQPAVDIERFVEVSLGATVDYGVELDERTLGFTIFDQPPRIVISRKLTDLATSAAASLGLRGRWRATLAHEAAHLLLHRDLFNSGGRSAYQTTSEVDGGPRDGWLEIQANMGMAALLVPRRLLVREVRARIGDEPVFPPLAPNSEWGAELTTWISSRFEVSRQLATFRLKDRGFVGQDR
jgi:hypothetical protein